MTGAELIQLRIIKIHYHLDKYLKAISFEMNDGTRSPQYGNAQELTQYFEIPLDKDISKIIVRQSDQSIRGLSLVDIQENTIIDIQGMQNSHFNERNTTMELSQGERLVGIKAGVDNWNEVAQLQFMTLNCHNQSHE